MNDLQEVICSGKLPTWEQAQQLMQVDDRLVALARFIYFNEPRKPGQAQILFREKLQALMNSV